MHRAKAQDTNTHICLSSRLLRPQVFRQMERTARFFLHSTALVVPLYFTDLTLLKYIHVGDFLQFHANLVSRRSFLLEILIIICVLHASEAFSVANEGIYIFELLSIKLPTSSVQGKGVISIYIIILN